MRLNKIGRASSPPRGFNAAAYQKRIDSIVGTRNGRPIVKLAWAPAERRWMPHRMEDEPQGYIFPIFCHGKDANGQLTAPDRWVLLERIEPPQFAPTWEAGRYSRYDGSLWDWKGPLPDEKYIELRAYGYHDGNCCSCIGDECKCGVEYNHCWGQYREPDEGLLQWIAQKAWEARHDTDVQPDRDIRAFEAPQAQRDVVAHQERVKQQEDTEMELFDREMRNVFLKQACVIPVDGFKRTDAGLIVPQ